MPLSLEDYWRQLLSPHGADQPGVQWSRLTAHPQWRELRTSYGQAPVLYALVQDHDLLFKLLREAPESLRCVDGKGTSFWPYALRTGLLEQITDKVFRDERRKRLSRAAHRPSFLEQRAPRGQRKNRVPLSNTSPSLWEDWLDPLFAKVPWSVTPQGEGVLAQTFFLGNTLQKEKERSPLAGDILKKEEGEPVIDIASLFNVDRDASLFRYATQVEYALLNIRQESALSTPFHAFQTHPVPQKDFWSMLIERYGGQHCFSTSAPTRNVLETREYEHALNMFRYSPLVVLPTALINNLASTVTDQEHQAWRHAFFYETLQRWYRDGLLCPHCASEEAVVNGVPCCKKGWEETARLLLYEKEAPHPASLEMLVTTWARKKTLTEQERLSSFPYSTTLTGEHAFPKALSAFCRLHLEKNALQEALLSEEGSLSPHPLSRRRL